MPNKILAVWGSPGSGKSVVAAKLARRLAERGAGAALLFCDLAAPMLPCACPPSAVERARSLGAVFAAARVTESLVRNNLTTLNCSDRLTLLGLQKGESARSYPPCQERQAAELIERLRGLADFAVVDCSSSLDALTLAALERAKNDKLATELRRAETIERSAEMVMNVESCKRSHGMKI
jgi:Mrp family chromosome partitioning ATPase